MQAFTTERGVDFSIRRLITEEYNARIKENKMEPVLAPRNNLPPYAIVGIGLIGLAATSPSLIELPVSAQAVLAGVVILLAISHEMHRA